MAKLANIRTVEYGLGEYNVIASASIEGTGWDQQSALRSLIERLEEHAKAIRAQLTADGDGLVKGA